MKKNKHIGSHFDDFLEEEGLLAEAEATAVKRRESLRYPSHSRKRGTCAWQETQGPVSLNNSPYLPMTLAVSYKLVAGRPSARSNGLAA